MREYETPLEKRLYISRRHKERYWTDAEYRLRTINRGRVAQGLPPRANLHDIMTPADIRGFAREQATRRSRAPNGQYLPESEK